MRTTRTPAQRYTIYAGLSVTDPPSGAFTAPLTWSIGYRDALDFLKQAFAEAGIKGFTVQRADGFWEGKEEDSIVVTLVSFDPLNDRVRVESVARSFKKHFKQEAVLVTSEHVNATMI